jgi:hypothetical protein
MARRLHSAALAGLCSTVFALACATAAGTHTTTAPIEVPPAIALPADEAPVLQLEARGTQNYECRAGQGAPEQREWALVAPEADLFDASGKKVGKHYAGPTWESTEDGSKVVGALRARADAPDPDAIPWLLLGATETSVQGTFGGIRSVQRLGTRGGKAPAGGCPGIGEMVKVPYSAVYSFSRAKG